MSDFLYPFLAGSEDNAEALLADLAESAVAKSQLSAELQASSLAALGEQIAAAGAAIAERIAGGGRIYTFGNGGSSTDAATLAALFAQPAHGRPVAARCLAADQAVLTALGNDIGFEAVFARQLIAHARSGDVAIALSTSGNSEDLLAGLVEAQRRGLLTLGFAGYDGGQMATAPCVDYCFTIDSQSIHRIQESQAMVGYHLWETVQSHLTKGATA